MSKRILRIVVYAFLGITMAGCASVKARSYVETKDRVDQDIDGNAGYLKGTPSLQESAAPARKTRNIYVVEITKNPVDEDEPIPSIEENPAGSSWNQATADSPKKSSWKSSPPTAGPDESTTPRPPSSFTPPSPLPAQYTVGKDDTLQTISKKFYNSYSKWPKIYEANKDKIDDPNRVRWGVVLTIPAL